MAAAPEKGIQVLSDLMNDLTNPKAVVITTIHFSFPRG